jgi:chemosensory pili system protein ChpA (sensor histidine kinase/response regulator)
VLDLAQRALDRLAAQVEEVGRNHRVQAADDLVEVLLGVRPEEVETPPPSVASGAGEAAVPTGEAYAVLGGEADLLQTFIDEANDLLETLDGAVQAWRKNTADNSTLAAMQRTLHTLKGGARIAGAMPIGDFTHAFESLLLALSTGDVAVSPQMLDLVQMAADHLVGQVEDVEHDRQVRLDQELLSRLEGAQIAEREAAKVPLPAPLPRPAPEAPVLARSKQEQIRVGAELLDRLVNNAGEVSIYRSRLEQQNTSLRFNLGELDQTLARLRNQLRHLEIETEAQIVYRWGRERDFEDVHQDFDPLEMDRFSTMQQLSRSLLETVNDLVNIKVVLGDLHRQTDTLLLQQSRVSTDLQDGLMRTRMVPFLQIVPRLHRLVRQTCAVLDKKAELQIYGANQELDRNILERMIAPLEHLLRNAVSHGIETPAARLAAGKDGTGNLSIHLGREGTSVLMNVVDDGAGVRLEAVRKRAIERGLLAPHAQLSDEDIIQFIFAPGFSTATELSQISGRGVGLDVVSSEVKQLGGSVEIQSHGGRGTHFVIRLPLTLAVSEALLAQVGDEIYAIPYPSIEGVVRVARADLEDFYRSDDKRLEYAGNRYEVRYLGGILGVGAVSLAEGRKWFPMLLVRSGEHRMALQVDGLLGNRQIVVKSVGRQLSSISWITGGTILADGRVALIIDVTALVRIDAAKPVARAKVVAEKAEEKVVTIMVVDDSITVRKVTSRLLSRHNMEVLTAKDGMDAVTQLQERVPDVMLLDIEMPRMDGFELARHMRNTAELRDIPIIMITSRSGEKHRDRAFELGVKRYLGKPYQETELLENIYAVLLETQT